MNFEGLSTEQIEELVNSGKLLSGSVPLERPQTTPNEQEIQAPPKAEKALAYNEVHGKSNPRTSAAASNDSNTSSGREETLLTPTREIGFDFKDPVELLYVLDDDIASGATKLHPWQIQFMLDFANERHNKDLPFQAVVQACNGSGKDKYIVAACIVWLCMRYIYARGIATNGSGDQLDNQTELHIDWLCKQANKKIAPGIWKCNYRYYECLPTASPIKLFATDEPGKAEGYHPLKTGAAMAIFASEAKSIPR